jgi:26S proteasome regulatory subunit N2
VSDLHLQFLFTHNRTDLQIIAALKDKLEARNAVTNSSAVIAHAMQQCGTTVDTFLRDNLPWLGRATHWAKFTATASIGVIHKGHRKESMKLLGSYLPAVGQQVCNRRRR